MKNSSKYSQIPKHLLEKEEVFCTNYEEGDAPVTGTLQYYLEEFFSAHPLETLESFKIDESDMTRGIQIWTTNFVLISVLGTFGGSLIWVPRNPPK